MKIPDPIAVLEQLFYAAVNAADPMVVIPSVLGKKPKGRVVVIGAGKASARMAEAVESVWGECEGLVITRYGYNRACLGIEIVEAAHPVPDQAGLDATNRMLTLLSGLTAEDHVLALISGGGSSLLFSPKDNISLSEKQQITAALLASGAPIAEMNIVRKHLSNVKGGQLAGAAYPATMHTLVISDVAGDDLAYIASGPTVGDDSNAEQALEILNKYKVELPLSVSDALKSEQIILGKKSKKLSTVTNQIISAPSQSIEAAKDIAIKMGFEVHNLGTDLEGEASDLGIEQARYALEIQKKLKLQKKPVLLLSGGECTVTQNVDGNKGVGGPNAEFLLSAAIELNGAKNIFAIACDTDGVDGAAEVAGATINCRTIERARSLNLVPKDYLTHNDSHSFFKKIGDQVITGPTLTNVNDFRAFAIFPSFS